MVNESIPGLVSIMMPAFNAEKFIGSAIQSIFEQSYQEWELIVVDDGSIDRTREIVEQFDDPRICLINQPNGGEASARNAALNAMRGEFVAFLDADDSFLPDHLELAVNTLQYHPGIDGVYSNGYHIDAVGNYLQTLSSRRRGPFEGFIFEQLVRASDVFGPPICVVVRRQPIIDHNLHFDTRIVIGPDWEFTTRYAEWTKFAYIDKPTCLYRVHETNISLRTNQEKRRASLIVCRENMVRLGSFSLCSSDTRSYVFYELLVELLEGDPFQQNEITQTQGFQALSSQDQARILRLMATQAVDKQKSSQFIGGWLRKSNQLDPTNRKSALLTTLYQISPSIFWFFIHTRYILSPKRQSEQSIQEVLVLQK